MNDNNLSLTVAISELSDNVTEKVTQINDQIANIGVSLILNRVGDESSYLTIVVNQQKLKEHKTRFAGRRKGTYSSKEKWKIKSISVQEVLDLREQGKEHSEIIEMIGCPRATYYRAWKKVKDDPDIDRDGNFFNFLMSKRKDKKNK